MKNIDVLPFVVFGAYFNPTVHSPLLTISPITPL